MHEAVPEPTWNYRKSQCLKLHTQFNTCILTYNEEGERQHYSQKNDGASNEPQQQNIQEGQHHSCCHSTATNTNELGGVCKSVLT